MTALTSRPGPSSLSGLPSISHRCLRRKSLRTYELMDPARPGAELSYDVGQVKEIVQMDKRLREEGFTTPVPAGFLEFATCFNQYAAGPERFATYSFSKGRVLVHKEGRPIVWEHFMIEDWLVGWNRDSTGQEASTSTSASSTMIQGSQIPPPLFDFTDSILDPNLKDLSNRMRVAIQTTDELTKFWIKRGAIEHQYASRLANLAETMIGEADSSALRRVIDALRLETAQQAMKRHDLANQIAVDLESRCLELQLKQRKHWRDVYEPAARKLHHDQVRGARRRSGVAAEWKQEYKKLRHSLDTRRLQSMKTNLNFSSDFSPLSESSPDSPKAPSGPAQEWESLRGSCLKMEMERCQFMDESLAAFLETLSVISATDRGSVSFITQWKDLFMPKEFVEEFSERFPGPKPIAVSTMPPLTTSTLSYVPVRKSLPPLTPIRGPRPQSTSGTSMSKEGSRSSFQTARDTSSREIENLPSTDNDSTAPARSSSHRERAHRSLTSFGITMPGRSHSRSQSQQKVLLPLASEARAPSPSPSRPTLSKFTNVFQRSSLGRSDRSDYAT
ncbi:hypothetical protein BDN70DRAFT_66520 [Pholiota conissans]|uniref:FCH domain-containing protein n=1 Tax=Pholiota conissans TaxID=109636 RepID=A0A9P5YYI4_9AGAR|nr:hypothetical protein BDN70DRAFT_66520 [Pholiota conissans]